MWIGKSTPAEGHSQNNSKDPWKQGAYRGKTGNWFNYGALTAFNPDEVKKQQQKKLKLDMRMLKMKFSGDDLKH